MAAAVVAWKTSSAVTRAGSRAMELLAPAAALGLLLGGSCCGGRVDLHCDAAPPELTLQLPSPLLPRLSPPDACRLSRGWNLCRFAGVLLCLVAGEGLTSAS